MDAGSAFNIPQWVATLLAALIAALVSWFVTYRYVVKRKRLTFYIAPSEDLTALLRTHAGAVSIKMMDQEVQQLNRAKITVKNTGNSTVTDVRFAVVIDGAHSFVTADAKGNSVQLSNAVHMKWEYGLDPKGEISVPFLNSKEAFEIQLFFDGRPGRCMVHCRMEDVAVRYKTLGYDDAIGLAAELLETVAPVSAAGVHAIMKALSHGRRR